MAGHNRLFSNFDQKEFIDELREMDRELNERYNLKSIDYNFNFKEEQPLPEKRHSLRWEERSRKKPRNTQKEELLDSPGRLYQQANVPRQSEVQRTLSFEDHEKDINLEYSPTTLQSIVPAMEHSSPSYKQPFESETNLPQQEISQSQSNLTHKSERPTVVQFPDVDFNQLSECQQRISAIMKTRSSRLSFSLRLSCFSDIDQKANELLNNDFTEAERALIDRIVRCRTSIIDELEEFDPENFTPIHSRKQSQQVPQQIFEREGYEG